MKQRLTLLMALFVLVITNALAYEWTDDNGVKWTFYNEAFTINGEKQYLWSITGAENYSENVTIPEKMIGTYSMYDQTQRKNVDVTDPTIEAIYGNSSSYYALFSSDNATGKVYTITLPKSIKYIGYNALNAYGATIIINCDTPPILGQYSNEYTSYYNSTIKVPDNLLATYREAEGWSNNQYTIISQSATTDYTVNASAQSNASTLHQQIGEENLGNVMSLTVKGTINSYDLMVIRNKMFNLHHLDLTDASFLANSYNYYKEYCVENDNSTGTYAFGGISRLVSIKLPKTLETISTSAFLNCSGLKSVEFQQDLVGIGSEAFKGCRTLESVSLKKGLKRILGSAFYYCNGLKTVTIAECDSIGSSVFYDCDALETVTWSSGRILCGNVFSSCENLTKITLPSNLKIIGEGAFSGCKKLTDFTLPDGLEMLGAYKYGQVGIKQTVNGKTKTIYVNKWYYYKSSSNSTFSGCSSLKGITIPDGITYLGKYIFSGCSGLETVNLPKKLTEIDEYAFSGCTSLTSISMPTTLQTIGEYAFMNCSALPRIDLPSSITNIGNYAFTGCTALNGIYTYTLEPTNINQQTFSSWRTATLWVQHFGYYNYWYDTQWSQFAEVKEFGEDYQFDYFYINNDYIFDDDLGVMEGTPDADLNAGSGLVVRTKEITLKLDEIHLANSGESSASIIADGNLTAEKVYFDITVAANKWYFLAFPFRVKLENVTSPGDFVFRYYDGQERATNGSGGWKNVSGDYLNVGTGYIFQTNAEGILTLAVEKADMDFSGNDRQDALYAYTADDASNASWNFIGNPHTAYTDINQTGYEAPITVWNGTTYEAIRPGDDQYFLQPFQAFFVQKPEDKDAVSFPADARYTYKQTLEEKAKAAAARTRTAVTGRAFVNLAIADGEGTLCDQTRVVFNEAKKTAYEMDCDAAKFFSDKAAVAQLFTLDTDGTCYAINERPTGEVALGYVAERKGDFAISAPRTDRQVWLRDNELGITHDLSSGSYIFQTAAGRFEQRFTLTMDGNTTAIDNVKDDEASQETDIIYDLKGQRVTDTRSGKGVYINNKGKKLMK